MKRIKLIAILVISILCMCTMLNCFAIGSVNAAEDVKVTRNIYSNNGSMKFTFTGLNLDTEHEYQYGLGTTKASEINDWFELTELTSTTATVNLITTTASIRAIINKVDTGYITIRDKSDSNKIVLEPYSVNLKMPYLKVTNFSVLNNGKEFVNNKTTDIQIALRNSQNSKAYYQYEKITDQNVISKYKEIKNKNGDYNEMEDILKTTVPSSNWNSWDYWTYSQFGTGMNGFGYPQKKIQAPDTGLYYLWVYFSGDNIKEMYGYILVDNLEPDIALDSITIPETAEVKMGNTLALTPKFNPTTTTNKIVTWTSSNEEVATVDNSGKVTPKKVGSTIITVTSQDGKKKANCTVTVTETKNATTVTPATTTNNNSTDTNKEDNKTELKYDPNNLISYPLIIWGGERKSYNCRI